MSTETKHTREPWLYTTGKRPECGQSIIVLIADGRDIYTGVYEDFKGEHPAEVFNESLGNNSVTFTDYDYWMHWPELNEPAPNQAEIDYLDSLFLAQQRISSLEAQLALLNKGKTCLCEPQGEMCIACNYSIMQTAYADLKAQLEKLSGKTGYCTECERLGRENRELREALTEIIEECRDDTTIGYHGYVISRARRALSGGG
jgi:hypothetical protein